MERRALPAYPAKPVRGSDDRIAALPRARRAILLTNSHRCPLNPCGCAVRCPAPRSPWPGSRSDPPVRRQRQVSIRREQPTNARTDLVEAGNGGRFNAHVRLPEQPNGDAVVVLQEAFSVNQTLRDVALRLAGEGYLAVAPDLFEPGIELSRAAEDMQRPSICSSASMPFVDPQLPAGGEAKLSIPVGGTSRIESGSFAAGLSKAAEGISRRRQLDSHEQGDHAENHSTACQGGEALDVACRTPTKPSPNAAVDSCDTSQELVSCSRAADRLHRTVAAGQPPAASSRRIAARGGKNFSICRDSVTKLPSRGRTPGGLTR